MKTFNLFAEIAIAKKIIRYKLNIHENPELLESPDA